MARNPAPGKCALCGETFNKQGITRHALKCRETHAPAAVGKAKPQKTFLLSVEGRYASAYWLVIELPAASPLRVLDQFLRDIWLECCGHLSAFTIGHVRYELDTGGIDGMWTDFFGGPRQPPRTMKTSLQTALQPKEKFYHEYDFGTTTELTLKWIGVAESAFKNKPVHVLARNNPPEYLCVQCQQPATDLCVECVYDGKGLFCDKHARAHKHDDMLMPIVNSPRTGECGYTGPAEY